MTEFKKIITNTGQELITSAALASGELVVKSIVIGDANGESYEPNAEQTTLVNQRNKLLITERIVNSTTSYTFLTQIPNDIDYYVIREIGLLDQNDNLIEIAQMEQETYIQSDNLIQQLTIGIQIDVGQSSVVIVLADTNIETASKDFVNNNFQKLSEKNQANGYAGLDKNGKLPLNKLSSTKLSNFNDDLGINPVHTHSQYLTTHQSLSGCADTDLSNLTSTGKDNLIKLAHELDWDNAIAISTTSSTTNQTYTCLADGIIYLQVVGAGTGSSGTEISTTAQFYINEGYIGNSNWQKYARSQTCFNYLAFKRGDVVSFNIYGSGPSITASAVFVPFKKS